MEGGITGYLKTVHRCNEKQQSFHRSKEDIKKSKKAKKSSDWFRKDETVEKFRSVLFVPPTPNSELVQTIRNLEARNSQGRESRIKVVEQSGVTVKEVLSRKYPWKPFQCGLTECFQCTTVGGGKISCRKPGVSYEITCTACEENESTAVYFGETSKTLFERGKKHMSEFRSGLSSNCMVIHNQAHHGGSKEFHFKMEGKKPFRITMDRQIDESMRMKFFVSNNSGGNKVLMNSGSEWRGDAIPRAIFGAPGLQRR